MICSAYNKTRTEGKPLLESQDTYAYGYKIKKGNNEADCAVHGLKGGSINSLVDDMFFNHSYWIASSISSDGSHIAIVRSVGVISNNWCHYTFYFRPLVCLKSNVHLVEKTNGTTTTYELELD